MKEWKTLLEEKPSLASCFSRCMCAYRFVYLYIHVCRIYVKIYIYTHTHTSTLSLQMCAYTYINRHILYVGHKSAKLFLLRIPKKQCNIKPNVNPYFHGSVPNYMFDLGAQKTTRGLLQMHHNSPTRIQGILRLISLLLNYLSRFSVHRNFSPIFHMVSWSSSRCSSSFSLILDAPLVHFCFLEARTLLSGAVWNAPPWRRDWEHRSTNPP